MGVRRFVYDKTLKKVVEITGVKATEDHPFHIQTDDFPIELQGTKDIQTGITLTTKSAYRKHLKEKGLVQISCKECTEYED